MKLDGMKSVTRPAVHKKPASKSIEQAPLTWLSLVAQDEPAPGAVPALVEVWKQQNVEEVEEQPPEEKPASFPPAPRYRLNADGSFSVFDPPPAIYIPEPPRWVSGHEANAIRESDAIWQRERRSDALFWHRQ